MPYLQDLTVRLALGASQLPDDVRERHGRWLRKQQHPDGGFGGREGGSDPYYTTFALRGLLILGHLDPQTAGRAGGFLRSRLEHRESIIDLLSIVFGAAILAVNDGIDVFADDNGRSAAAIAELLESMRTADGGYAKTQEGRAGSTYQTFLNLLCCELIEHTPPAVEEIANFILSQQHDEGGFLEIRVGKRAGVNPTAAAIGSLKLLGKLTPKIAEDTADFLAPMQSDEGGLTANSRVPFPDLLSSCTGLITLVDLCDLDPALSDAIDPLSLRNYAYQMERPDGGFAGFVMDPDQDVEYTFYGLATLALCALMET
ncbi:MAG: prenyltransferase/squalene oxidase repeat-containing protein [Planctomycetota bacterium]